MKRRIRRGRAVALAMVLITGAPFGGAASTAGGLTGVNYGRTAAGSAPVDPVSCEAAHHFGNRWGTSLRGDVDGDGIADTVTSRAEWLAGGECRAWLVVNTAEGRFRSPIDPLYSTLIKPPGIAGLIKLRPGDRLDVAVVVWLGASVGFLDVCGITGDRLLRLSRNAYEYAGSAAYRVGVDCSAQRGSRLVASSATWSYADGRYHVGRTFYGMRAGLLTVLPRLSERHLAAPRALARYPELAVLDPFPSCTAVVGT